AIRGAIYWSKVRPSRVACPTRSAGASAPERSNHASVPERPKGAACKAVYRGFKSRPALVSYLAWSEAICLGHFLWISRFWSHLVTENRERDGKGQHEPASRSTKSRGA